MLVATVSAVALLGVWILPTVYLYWQWFNYTRQSYGVERIYRRKAGDDGSTGDCDGRRHRQASGEIQGPRALAEPDGGCRGLDGPVVDRQPITLAHGGLALSMALSGSSLQMRRHRRKVALSAG